MLVMMFSSLTVGTARYIMITLEVARAFNKSDINPVMIAPIENKVESKLLAWLIKYSPNNVKRVSMFSSLNPIIYN